MRLSLTLCSSSFNFLPICVWEAWVPFLSMGNERKKVGGKAAIVLYKFFVETSSPSIRRRRLGFDIYTAFFLAAFAVTIFWIRLYRYRYYYCDGNYSVALHVYV